MKRDVDGVVLRELHFLARYIYLFICSLPAPTKPRASRGLGPSGGVHMHLHLDSSSISERPPRRARCSWAHTAMGPGIFLHS